MSAPALTAEEARVLGCLLEKAATTPEHYPLSLNALVTACNQTTNRDPVVRYGEEVVEDALAGLRDKGLARRLKAPGQRVVKHRHVADEALGLDGGRLALLGVLLLRGPQTPGELKTRTERWHSFASPAEVEEALDDLASAEHALVARLARRPGWKEDRWAQLLTADAVEGGAHEALAHEAQPAGSRTERAETEPAAVAAPLPRAIEVRDPATGEVIRTLEVDDDADVAAKVARARRAGPSWSARSYEERAAAVVGFRDLLAAEAEELARVLTAEVGKPIAQSRNEIGAVGERIDWFVEHVPRVVAPQTVTDTPELVERVTYEPVGTVAHVSAWNYPYFVGLNSIVPALLTGNTVLYKPSELATLTGLRIADLFHRAGVPADVLQVVVGGGATGAALVASDVDLVCFTGSYATGVKVAASAAERLARVQLELGGKDAAYVTDDVDVPAVASALAEGVFYNAGQSCCAVERIYVHERVWDAFVDAFAAATDEWQPGDPDDNGTTLGPLTRPGHLDVLEAQVADAVARGATAVVAGGRIDRPGQWFAPTVLTGVDHSMAVMRDETFGPVIGMQRVRDDDEAVELIDDTEYGLTGAVFTRDAERAQRLLARFDTGTVYWNCSDRTTARLPWAGRRHSGLGVSMGDDGIRAFTRAKAWHLRP